MNKDFLKFRFLGIAAFLAMIAVFSVAAMLLWNALMPDIFGLPALNYWQALGLVVLARVFFGGLGIGRLGLLGGHGRYDREERLFRHGNQLREKWMNMTREERMAFIEKEKGFHHFFHDRFSRFHDFFDGNEPEAKKEKAAPQGDGNE